MIGHPRTEPSAEEAAEQVEDIIGDVMQIRASNTIISRHRGYVRRYRQGIIACSPPPSPSAIASCPL